MATFKAVVLRHQLRRDGKYPVSIRVIHNRKPCYISTGLYCTRSQINKRTFEIKDQFILARTGQTILKYEKQLLEIDTETLWSMSVQDLCALFKTTNRSIDFLARCRELIAENPTTNRSLRSALTTLEEMGITQMMVTDFTAAFLRRFKDYLDNKQLPIRQNGKIIGYKPLKVQSKMSYVKSLNKVFRLLVKEYNTEFHKVIKHDPFIGFENYKVMENQKRSLTVEQLRQFFDITTERNRTQVALDVVKMSFCLCGINLLDLQLLTKEQYDPINKRITFVRHKTQDKCGNRVEISIHIEPEVEALFEKYRADDKDGRLLDFGEGLPSHIFNQHIGQRVRIICEQRGIGIVTPYQFRHSWATIARNNCDVSKDDIDLCLAHVGNNPMADVYIRPDWSRIDRANRKVLDFVFGGQEKLQ